MLLDVLTIICRKGTSSPFLEGAYLDSCDLMRTKAFCGEVRKHFLILVNHNLQIQLVCVVPEI